MIAILVKKQWKTPFLLVIFLCGIVFMRNHMEVGFAGRFCEQQKGYLEKFDLSQRASFFEQLERDKAEAQELVSAIENYEAYEGELFTELLDPLMVAALEGNYVDYDMVTWKQGMLRSPGKYTDTVQDDNYMMSQLSARLENQKLFEENLSNQIEIMKRGIRRGDGLKEKYTAVLAELEKVDRNFPVEDTYVTERVFSYFETDFYILMIIVLLGFGVFSGLHQNKISNQIAVSRMNAGTFCVRQLAATVLVSIGAVLVYDGIVLLTLSGGDVGAVAWKLPIQAVRGYEYVSFALRIWQYVCLMLVYKLFFCILVLGVVLLLSAVSKHTIAAALLSFAVFVALWFWYQTSKSAFLVGSCKGFLEDLAFTKAGNIMVPHLVWAFAAVVAGSFAVLYLVVWSYKITVKKWVK